MLEQAQANGTFERHVVFMTLVVDGKKHGETLVNNLFLIKHSALVEKVIKFAPLSIPSADAVSFIILSIFNAIMREVKMK